MSDEEKVRMIQMLDRMDQDNREEFHKIKTLLVINHEQAEWIKKQKKGLENA